jgi:hypothetical protein
MEQVLLAERKTKLHDDLLAVLSLHVSPDMELPRHRMIAVSPETETAYFAGITVGLRSRLLGAFWESAPQSTTCSFQDVTVQSARQAHLDIMPVLQFSAVRCCRFVFAL